MSHLPHREIMEPLEQRLIIAKNGETILGPSSRGNGEMTKRAVYKNCYGTTFFLYGVLPYDFTIYTNGDRNVKAALSKMQEIPEPIDDSIVIISNEEEFVHAAYIKTINPFEGFHREGAGGSLKKFESIKEIEDKYLSYVIHGWGGLIYKFYKLDNKKQLSEWAKALTEDYNPWADC